MQLSQNVPLVGSKQGSEASKLGGNCAIVVGILYALIGIIFILLPPEQQDAAHPQFLSSLAQNGTMSLLLWLTFGLVGLFALAVVPPVSRQVYQTNPAWVRWASNLAFLGFAVTAVENFRTLGLMPQKAAAYVAGDATIQAAIQATANVNDLDPLTILGFGCVGFWVLVVSVLALRNQVWPKSVNIVGALLALVYALALIGNAWQIVPVIQLAALGAIILAPIWYIWMGLLLRRASPTPAKTK